MQHKDSTAAPEILQAQSENGETPSLYRLLATYWDQYDALCQAMNETDRTKDGTPARERADAAQTEAGNRLDEASFAILAFLPTWSIDARIKADFVSGLADRNGGHLTSEETEVLLASLPNLVAAKKGGDA